MKRSGWLAVASAMALTAGTAAAQDAGVAHPDRWPMALAQAPDTAIEARINTLLASMSLEQKVGQIVQGDIGRTTPDDVATHHLGSVLNGDSSSPGGDDNGAIAVRPVDCDSQQDAREIGWSGKARGTLIVANPRAADLSGAGPLAQRPDLRVDQAPAGPARGSRRSPFRRARRCA